MAKIDRNIDIMKSGLSPTSSLSSIFRHVRYEHLLAGVSGGVVATLVLHPLDLVKIRFQVSEGYGHGVVGRPAYKGLVHALQSITRSNGFTGLYQGVTPNVWGAGLSWGLYFFFYNSIKEWMQDGDKTRALGPLRHITAASEAGLLTLILTNPIWVTKTRLCLQYNGSGAGKVPATIYYKGMTDALIKIYKIEGLRGLYKGFVPGVIGISHGSIQFMVYEELKNVYNAYRHCSVDTRLNSAEYLAFAAMSKMVAAVTTYPYQVLRSRLQDQLCHYDGVMDCFRKIVKYEGVQGLYRGLPVYLVHVTPNICIVFLLYEYISNWKSLTPLVEVKEQGD